ncbi:hypothetical protein ABX050_001439 [Salmonella enterica]
MDLNAYEHPGWMHPQFLAFDPDVSCTSNGIQNEMHCGLQPEFHRFWCLIAWDTKPAYRSVSPLHKTRFGGFLLIRPVKGIEVAEDASVTIRQLIDSRGDIILFVFVMRNTKRYGLRSF